MNKRLILCHIFLIAGIMLIFSASAFAIPFTFSNFAWESDSIVTERVVSGYLSNNNRPSFQTDDKKIILYNHADDDAVPSRFISLDTSLDTSDKKLGNDHFYQNQKHKQDNNIQYYNFITPMIQKQEIGLDDYYYVEGDESPDMVPNSTKNIDMNSISWNSYYKTATIEPVHFMYENDSLREDPNPDAIQDVSDLVTNRDFMIFYTSDISKFVDTSPSELEKTGHKLWRKIISLLESAGETLRQLF